MRIVRTIATVIALAAVAVPAIPAQAGESPWWVPRLRDSQVAGTGTEKKAQDETPATPAAPAPAPAEPGAAAPATGAAAGATAAAAATTAAAGAPAPPAAPAPPPLLPNSALAKTSRQLRQGPIGQEPNAVAYLDLIDVGKASPAQVNDFAAYLAKRGGVRVALQFQQYAVALSPKDTTLWLNLGTIQRTLGNLGPAADAFQKAIEIDSSNALAHYNLGAVYDADKKYDDSIEEYRRALVLDPELGDPRKNPQVVNNENLLAVKLKIYDDRAGSLGLPLLQMQKTPVAATKDAPATKGTPAAKDVPAAAVAAPEKK